MSKVRCRFCDHENPDDARFCNACGSPVHLKPCPQCEAVNDVSASQCYECGATLDAGATASGVAAVTEAAASANTRADGESRHVPESLGARLADLPPMEGSANVAAAERRDAYTRSSRTSRALFFVVVLLVFAAVGYYGYEHAGRLRGDAVTASTDVTKQEAPAVNDRPTPATPPENTGPPATASNAPAKSAEPQPVVASAPPPTAVEEASPVQSSAASATESSRTASTATAKTRPASARPVTKPDTDPYSRPAAASNASAVATQQMIDRYLGIRAGAAPQRSPY